MTTKFKCWAAHDKSAEFKEWEYVPRDLKPNEIEIKIHSCGICGSDVHQLDSGWGQAIYPIVPGHEIIGEVVQVGSDVKNLKIGMRVGVGPQCTSCGTCDFCTTKQEHLCRKRIWTYNDRYEDGTPTYGGYSQYVRVHDHFAVPIPDSLSTDEAAPLLCAGITTYSPLKYHGVGKGQKLGVIGIGGLGHLAVQFGAALGAEVTAISSSPDKEQEARTLGAHHFLNSKDKDALKKHLFHFDVILSTVSHSIEWDRYLRLLKPFGKFIMVGLPNDKISMRAQALTDWQVVLTGSVIGSPSMIVEMLEFCAQHNIKAKIQTWPIEKVNEAIENFRKGKPHFRYVLKIQN